MAFQIQYSISEDFPNAALSSDRLIDEIEDSTIVTLLRTINTNGDNCYVIFVDEPSADEKITLDGIVATHSGEPFEPAGFVSSRTFFPASWYKENTPAGQATGVAMQVTGTAFEALPVPRMSSLLSVGIVLSEAVTANFIRFELTLNGTPTGKTVDMDSGMGTARIWEFKSGRFMLDKGDRIGVNWGSHPALAPDGVIDALVFFEME